MFTKIINFRFVFIIAVFFLLLNSLVFLIVGAVRCIHGYTEFVSIGFMPNEESLPGIHLLEGLDFFMYSLVFMIFGFGLGRLFLFQNVPNENLPSWIQINNLMDLKHMLWETILVAMVIFTVTNIAKIEVISWKMLLLPLTILILSFALYLIKDKNNYQNKTP